MQRVEVWVAPLDGPPAANAGLSPAEWARAKRYRFPDDARRFTAARSWLRRVLGAELGVAPADVAFADGPGKPRLRDEAGVRFNLSYTEDVALIAVADREVGVDVEHLGRGLRILDAASVACTPEEIATLHQLPPDPRAEEFLRLWTAKEAVLKATGQGLTVPPDRVRVGARRAGAATPVVILGDASPPRWWVRELRPAPGYVGAVAAEGGDWDIHLRIVTAADL